MFGKNTSDDIFVDVDAKSERDGVGDAWTSKTEVALFQINNRRDEFPRWTFRSRSP